MKSRGSTTVAAIMTVLLLGTITVVTITNPENVFAYKTQSASQMSACGNEIVPINTGCQNTDSQIQGDENGATLRAKQTLPEMNLFQKEPPETPPPTEPQTCVGCLAPLLEHEGLASEVAYAALNLPGIPAGTPGEDEQAISVVCEALECGLISFDELIMLLENNADVQEALMTEEVEGIINCLKSIPGLPN